MLSSSHSLSTTSHNAGDSDDVSFCFCVQNPFLFPYAGSTKANDSKNEDSSNEGTAGGSSSAAAVTLAQTSVSHDERDLPSIPSNAMTKVPETFLEDCMFAKTDQDAIHETLHQHSHSQQQQQGQGNGVGSGRGVGSCPTNYQKLIELILRLEKRGLMVEPRGMLVRRSNTGGGSGSSRRHNNNTARHNNGEEDKELLQSNSTGPSGSPNDDLNYFHGYALQPDMLYYSPDRDEVFLQCTAPRAVLLQFASQHALVLPTHPFSFGCGQAMPYDVKLEQKLRQSVERYYRLFPPTPAPANGDSSAAVPLNLQQQQQGSTTMMTAEGFLLTSCDKMRLTYRLLDEDWLYGGCGLPLAEMRRKQVFVKQLMPLHNLTHAAALQLDKWSSFGVLLTTDPLYHEEAKVLQYYGEEVALYFTWLNSYTKFLMLLAIPGTLTSCLTGIITDAVAADTLRALYAAVCIVWGAWWLASWNQRERTFAATFNQDAHVSQENVRDDFRHTDETPLQPDDIFRLNLKIPLTVKKKPDGTIIQLHSSHRRRLLIRHLVCYPLIGLLAAAMVTAHVFNTKLRYEYPNDNVVSYGCSVLSIVISNVFAQLFDKIVPILNSWENHRTYTEEMAQWVGKSFQFYFFSNYAALFTIALWPTVLADPGKDPDRERLEQLQTQMLIITVVKPMINNALELSMPWLKQQLRLRVDLFGSLPAAICSLLKRQPLPSYDISNPTTTSSAEGEGVDLVGAVDASSGMQASREAQCRMLWSQSLLEPYESPSGDYLEITLQFGFMTMFASSFPFAALACLFYNVLEMRIDSWKLLHLHQRPTPRAANTIGSWAQIAFYLVGIAVITNSYVCAVISDLTVSWRLGNTSTIPTTDGGTIPLDEEADTSLRFKAFALMQYALLLVMLVVVSLGSSGASEVEQIATAKQWVLSNVSVRRKFLLDVRATGATDVSLHETNDASDDL